MATFSVDITDVVFAGTRTGYKDITITGMPAGGVTVSLTGDYATYFTYTNNPDSKGINVYRVSTKSTNDSSSGYDRTATFEITNKSDSLDYVNVSLKQYCTSSYNGAYVRYVISNYSDIYGHTYSNKTDIYFPYSLSDSTAKVELYVDGSISEVTVPSWASYVNETTYTDTGFSRLLISCTNNYDGPRVGRIKFRTSTVGGIYQNGYPSSTSGCTQSISFLKSGGTKTIELKIPSSYNVRDINYSTEGDFIDSLSISKISGTRLNYSVTVGNNNTGNDLDFLVKFTGNSGSSSTYLGHTIITQSAEDTPSPTLTVDPTSLTYPASGGAIVLDVTYSGTLTTSEFPSWLTYETVNVDSTHRSYTITASKNSSTSSRNFNLEISNGTDTVTVPITQAGAEAASLTISPTGASVGSAAGTTSVTVTSKGIDTVEYSIAEGWVSLKTQSSNVYTFSYTANTSSSQRSCTITFYGGGLSKSFVINQAAGAISVSPTSSNVGSTSGTIQVTVKGSSNITYSISDSWITYQSKSGDVYTFAYTQNTTSSQRTTTVTFSASGMTDGVFTLTQAASAPASLTISPTSNSVINSSGSVQITVTSSGISDVQYNISDSWITFGSKSGNVYTFNYSAKTSTGQRTGTITFSGGGLSKTYTLTQEGISADSITVNKNILSVVNGGGYFRTELTVTYTGKVTVSSSSWITGVSSFPSTGTYDYSFSVSNNTETESGGTLELRKGYIEFTGDNGTSCRVDIYQGGNTYGKRPVCIPDHTLGTYPAEGGQKYLVIDYYDKLTYTGVPSWITLDIVDGGTGATESIDDTSPVIFSVEAARNNSSSSRNGTMVFQGGDSLSLKKSSIDVSQDAGALIVSPKSQNVDFTSGTVQVTVTGANNINYSISDSWLTYQSKSGNVYTFSYDTNNNFYSRTSTVTFSASEFEPVTYTLVQYGRTASFSVIPSSLTFHKEGGSDNLTFFNIPDGGLSWDITYGSGTDWISSLSFNNNVATVTVTENTGSRRNAVIRFYNKNDNDDYLDLNVVQNGEGFDSIWFDRSFEPSSFQVGENYHYRLQDHNTNKIIYEGITVPVSDTEKPLGINIPRLVDSYIHSDELDGLREDMKLRTLNGSLSVDFYDMNGSTPSLVKTFNYWNDWSGPGYNTVYDITQSINDPINHKGCNYMVIPFCIYDDELSSYSVVETKKDDTQVSYPMGTPSDAFMYAAGEFFNAKSVSFKKGNDTLLTYDMDNCGEGFLLYKNRFGGWDSFLIEGNIYKYDEYTRLRGVYPKYPNGYGYSREKMTDRNTIKTRYEINTGWLTDEQAERLVFHLMSSTTVALRSFSDRTTSSFPYNMVSVSIVDSSVEYKKFKNGKKMINYTITLEENDTKQVQR